MCESAYYKQVSRYSIQNSLEPVPGPDKLGELYLVECLVENWIAYTDSVCMVLEWGFMILIWLMLMTIVCSGQSAEVYKASGQARPHPQPAPAWRRWFRPALDALDGEHCVHGDALETQEFSVGNHSQDVLHPSGCWRHARYEPFSS